MSPLAVYPDAHSALQLVSCEMVAGQLVVYNVDTELLGLVQDAGWHVPTGEERIPLEHVMVRDPAMDSYPGEQTGVHCCPFRI